jgi:hypothetical protein
MDDTLSLAMKGYQVKGLALHNEDLFYKLAKGQHPSIPAAMDNDNMNYLYKTLIEPKSRQHIWRRKVSYIIPQ